LVVTIPIVGLLYVVAMAAVRGWLGGGKSWHKERYERWSVLLSGPEYVTTMLGAIGQRGLKNGEQSA
jgi:hypothetical protein